MAVSGFRISASDDNKNCWFVLNTSKPLFTSIPSNNSDGNVEPQAISIVSLAPTASADSAKKSGSPKLPGLDSMTFSPAKKANLFLKKITLLIGLSTNDGNGLVFASPTALSAYLNSLIVNVASSVDALPGFSKAVLCIT